jgi:uncharacterized membrane protein required for colicin V production
MGEMAQSLTTINFITIAIVLTLLVSVIQGMVRGASKSAKHLIWMITEAVITIGSMYVAWQGVQYLSPLVQSWLKLQNLQIPTEEIGLLKQTYYTMVTAVRDFPLLRFGILFVLGYVLVKQILYRLADPLISRWLMAKWGTPNEGNSFISATTGGLLGSVAGLARALILVAALFIYATLYPVSSLTGYIKDSQLYQKGAEEVIAPFTGGFIADKVPVFTRAVEQEFTNILQRKYEVLDARIPDDIAAAAKEVTANGESDEEKAKQLYKWVGNQVKYDWNKVKLYEEQRIWKEQTPEDTFRTREGVCIDYSRLYAVMARSIGLEVKVVTGLGYDGQGGYGPHAWNEVYLSESDRWVPLDSTWVSSGGNWFDPPNFDQTHIRDA